MAGDVKKDKIKVDKTVDVFGEFKGKKAPAWVALRPKLKKETPPLVFRRAMELDGRKWKKKDIEDGVYAVARYELAIFATKVSDYDKAIMKAVAANKPYKGKLPKNPKDETPELTKALDAALREVPKIYKSVSKKIEDKVSLALDEVENDTGDNKKGLAGGKEALKRFEQLGVRTVFMKPGRVAVGALTKLAGTLDKAKDEKQRDDAFKLALADAKKAETEFEAGGKQIKKVIDYMIDTGVKLANDQKSAPELQAFGKKFKSGDAKNKLEILGDIVGAFSRDLDEIVRFLATGNASAKEVKEKAKDFQSLMTDASTASASAKVTFTRLAKRFRELTKDLK